MSVNEELLQPSSDSFWEVDCYRRTVKRHEDGHRLCGDLITLIQERADIEKHYAKSLRTWATKWGSMIDKGPEYGTTQSAWLAVLEESNQIADLHLQIKERLISDVQNSVKQWRQENYTKPMVGAIKETKELEDGFRKAQKPWSKRLVKVIKAKKEYHNACRMEKSAINQESNARGDSGVSPDQVLTQSPGSLPGSNNSVKRRSFVGRRSSLTGGANGSPKLKKLQDKVEKYKNDVDTTRKKYESALNELNSYNAKYMEDMTEIFNKSQEYEEKRVKFFKEMMFGVQKSLNISDTEELKQIYEQFWQTVDNADHSKDLRWWSQNNGVDMAMNWPTFEEYSPEARSITTKSKKNAVTGDGGIMLTSVQHKNDTPPSPVTQTNQQHSYDNFSMSNNTNQAPNSNSDNGTQNPFGDEDWEAYEQPPVDDAKGVPVRALYDYVGQEEDELSFKAGELFIKLLDADDQGWCTGKKDGKVGLYPNNYVETVD